MLDFINDYKTTDDKDEIRISCPFCHSNELTQDTEYHLYLNTKRHIFICFRCGTSGTSYELEKALSIGGESMPSADELKNTIISRLLKNNNSNKNDIEFDLNMISIPLDKNTSPIAYNYITKRGFLDNEISRYNMRVGISYFDKVKQVESKFYSGRILWPYEEQGKTRYLVGRSYDGMEPKYKNVGKSKKMILYKTMEITDKVIICEGIISAIAATRITNEPAISLLGKTASEFQIAKIRNLTSEVIMCMDGDVSRTRKNDLNRQFICHGFKVWEINLPDKTDPDDAGADFIKYFNKMKRIKL